MTRLTCSILENNFPTVFTSSDLKRLEPDSHIRYHQVNRAIKAGDIVRIRRGFYTLNKILRKGSVNVHVLAQKFVPESYISFETALWDAGWIPDFVFEIASVAIKPLDMIITDFARFSYTQIEQKDLFTGIEKIISGSDYYLEAKPLKALADYVYLFNYDWNTLKPLISSLRIEPENLESLTPTDFDEIQGNYSVLRVERFLNGIRKELCL
jgi:hypothetical protein